MTVRIEVGPRIPWGSLGVYDVIPLGGEGEMGGRGGNKAKGGGVVPLDLCKQVLVSGIAVW